MMIHPASNLACSIDGTPLSEDDTALRCPHGHSYDRARGGYVNLLGSQHKASSDPGDSKEMIAARRAALNTSLYQPLADTLFDTTRGLAAHADTVFRIADAGCGEGYYLDRLRHAALACPDPARLELTGVDISKWAIQAAAKRTDAVAWIVGNNRHLPFLAGSVDLILCMFGFPVYDAFAKVQATGGHLLLADPGPDHLIELRALIYPEVRQSGPPSLEAAAAVGYRLEQQHTVRYQAALTSQAQITNLLMMTPHYFRMPRAGHEALAALEGITVTVDVVFRLLQKKIYSQS